MPSPSVTAANTSAQRFQTNSPQQSRGENPFHPLSFESTLWNGKQPLGTTTEAILRSSTGNEYEGPGD